MPNSISTLSNRYPVSSSTIRIFPPRCYFSEQSSSQIVLCASLQVDLTTAESYAVNVMNWDRSDAELQCSDGFTCVFLHDLAMVTRSIMMPYVSTACGALQRPPRPFSRKCGDRQIHVR